MICCCCRRCARVHLADGNYFGGGQEVHRRGGPVGAAAAAASGWSGFLIHKPLSIPRRNILRNARFVCAFLCVMCASIQIFGHARNRKMRVIAGKFNAFIAFFYI